MQRKNMYFTGPRFLCRLAAFVDFLWPLDVGAPYMRRAADLPLRRWVGAFPRFVVVGFCFLSEALVWVASPIIFLFIRGRLALGGWCCTPLQRDFALDPVIPPFDFHFRIYKLDLAILTE